MKSMVLEAPGVLKMHDGPVPQCPEGGLLLKTLACAVCSTDIKAFRHGHRDLIYPRILGHEIVGEIVESRAQGEFKTGDRVQVYPGICCGTCPSCLHGAENQCATIKIIGFNYDGGFSEYVAIPRESVTGGGVNLLPEGFNPAAATLAEPLASCLNSQQACEVTPDDTVLILGAGAMGLLQAMLAWYNGARKILITETMPSRQAIPEDIPVDRVIDPSREDLLSVVKTETDGRGVDVILIAFGSADISSLPDLLAPRGRICLFSGLPKEEPRVTIDANAIHYRELKLVGAYGSTSAHNRMAVELITSGKLPAEKLITATFSLENIIGAMEYNEQNKGLKAVITF